MAEKPYTRAQRAAVRRISTELGLTAHSGLKGVLLGAAMIAALFTVAAACLLPVEPGQRAYGRVEGISLNETDMGTRLLARVQTGDEYGLVPVPAAAMCAAGDRIELVRRRTLLNVRYTLGVGGCTRVR